KERKDSVKNGLDFIRKEIEYVLIHDGARPFPGKKIIRDIMKNLKRYPGVVCGMVSPDTVKAVKESYVNKTLERENIFFIQTPQGFKKDIIVEAYSRLGRKRFTDDAQFLEVSGERVKVIPGSKINFKVTYPEDLILARALLENRLV
ncbi:MAG: 2-C-methyl-D-erythritol 4-phosphate cytidylyltransferase, partial [Candidatus Omnitrophica bacterium]|nr:2-C-methyl-D-erythritol 4-phosphate cytidylyltransferase [Candidatus Omnitrophota bacterium]MBD3269162.1 2-C-methyl-D-erythritol 4-phosphate cytidylyltransferase [Candidatus Omnitrophota bacterium]